MLYAHARCGIRADLDLSQVTGIMKSLSEFASLSGVGLANLSMTLIFLVSLTSCDLSASSSSSPRVGGPCTYKQYKGDAEIVSVIQRPGGLGEYEIKFSFHPQETIQEEFARVEGRQWILVQKDSSYPQNDFLTQYGINAGKRFPCYLKVITKGTCTPVLFEFPTINNGTAQ
jgi:hypothetical protein